MRHASRNAPLEPDAGARVAARLTGPRRRTWNPGLVAFVALTYVVVVAVFLAAGYLVGRLLL